MIAYEIKKDKIILNIANGFSWGIIVHIMLDLIFGIGKIDIFWPLPIGIINGWNYGDYKYLMLGLDLLFFRLLASELVKKLLNNPTAENITFIKPLTLWMKYQLYIVILFFIAIYFNEKFTLILFGIFYIPNYIMSVVSIYKIKDCLE